MKYLKKKDKLNPLIPVIGLCFVLALGLLLWMVAGGKEDPTTDPTASGQEQTDPQLTEDTHSGSTDQNGQTEPTEPPGLVLPYTLEHGKLTVDSIFQFTGLNPDKNNEEAEDVAAIQLTNTSQEHLASLTVTVTTTGGITASFTAYDIPPGMSAMVMSPNNIPIETNPDCTQITCEAVFLPQSPLAADQLLISVIGTEITVENISGEDLSQITIYCHSMLDQSCYGGTTVAYEIDSLPAGESTVVSAWDCYLGLVEVVRIEIGSE